MKINKLATLLVVACMLLSPVSAMGAQMSNYVTLPPDVTDHMLWLEFWLRKLNEPDKVILTPKQVEELNRKGFDELEWLNSLDKWPDKITGDDLREKMDVSFPEGDFYIDDLMVTKKYWDRLKVNMNLDNVEDVVNTRYGFVTLRTNVKRYPTADIITDEPGDIEYDELQETAAFTWEPVVILHESLDGMFYYCVTEYYSGWISKNNIGICRTKTEWVDAQDEGDFLLITGNMITADEIPYAPAISGMTLYMGTKLPLVPVSQQPKTLYGRQVLGSYVVKVPVRGIDSYVTYELLPIPISKDVHIGYLSYTYRNVLNQLFKMQGDRYGWGGMRNARDCSALTQELYRCFGLYLPRNGGWQAEYVGQRIDLTDKTNEQKEAILTNQIKPGDLLQFPGHITVYLGKHSGKHYVMSAAGGYGVYDESENAYEYSTTRSVYINALDIKRTSGKSWLESLTTAVCLR